jgi:hypothetical protein
LKFFTRKWVNGATDDEAADAVVPGYWRHLETLGLHQSLKDLAELNPHDGYILNVEHEPSTHSLRLRLRCGDLQAGYFDAVLTFVGATITPADKATLAEARHPAGFEILYDEVDREAGAFVYRLLLHPAGETSIRFNDVAVVRVPVADRRAITV